jgi:thiosulfate dehydrogenase (quinone) large subunit
MSQPPLPAKMSSQLGIVAYLRWIRYCPIIVMLSRIKANINNLIALHWTEREIIVMAQHVLKTPRGHVVTNPPMVRLLFDDVRFAFVWLLVRIGVGLVWIENAVRKLNDPAWMETGEALRNYWANAVKIPETGRPPITFDWYRSFIQGMLDNGWYTWFAKFVAIGELLVGVALVVGLFVGIAAFFGAFMNWNYLMAGSTSMNPLLFVAALLLMFAWKTAGYIGLDRWIVPLFGATWEDEEIELQRRKTRAEKAATAIGD